MREKQGEVLWETQDQKIKLRKEDVENAKPNSIIYKGTAMIQHPYFNQAKRVFEGGNLEKDNRSVKVKFVIYRGGAPDWCIYHSLNANLTKSRYLQGKDHLEHDFETVKRAGGKLHDNDQILSIVDADKEVLDMYRH